MKTQMMYLDKVYSNRDYIMSVKNEFKSVKVRDRNITIRTLIIFNFLVRELIRGRNKCVSL